MLSLPRRNRQSIALKMMRIAATVLLILGSSYFISRFIPAERSRINMQSLYVPPGSRAYLVLADSSRVWLNSNSTLRYPDSFNDPVRTVQLEGEAFFDVAKHPEQSFIVKTGKYDVEALGTSFNIEAYSDSYCFTTALFTGCVKISGTQNNAGTLYLKAGETVTRVGDSLLVSPLKTDIYRWREGLIVINNYSFETVMHCFEKYFDTKIIIDNPKVKTLNYQGKFRIADGVDHALRVLQKDVRFVYKRDEDTNIIHIY
jgi:ferric-dicitrate binding protein FerR (iron transport regulator)